MMQGANSVKVGVCTCRRGVTLTLLLT